MKEGKRNYSMAGFPDPGGSLHLETKAEADRLGMKYGVWVARALRAYLAVSSAQIATKTTEATGKS